MKNNPEQVTISVEQNAYLEKERSNIFFIKVLQITILVVFLILWEAACDFGWIDGFFYSSPKRIVLCAIRMCKGYILWIHIGITLIETIISFFLVNFISLILAVLLWCFKRFAAVSEPYLIVLNSLPKSALAPLLIVWLGTGMTTIIVAGISVAIFGSIMNLYTEFVQTDYGKVKLIYTLGGSKWDVLTKLVLPGNIPTIISTMKVNIGLSLVGVIIGEFLSARIGLGYLIIYGSQVFKLDMLIMSIVILCIIAMGLYFILQQISKKTDWN